MEKEMDNYMASGAYVFIEIVEALFKSIDWSSVEDPKPLLAPSRPNPRLVKILSNPHNPRL